MSVTSSLSRLKLCSLSRLERMSGAVSDQILKLQHEVRQLEEKCEEMALDDDSVRLHESHGEFQLEFDRFEYELDCLHRNIEDLEDKKATIEEVRMVKSLEKRQVEKLGSIFLVKLKDTLLFLLILLVLSLLAMETYKIGVSGGGAKVEVLLNAAGKVLDTKIIDSGSGYEAVEIMMAGDSQKEAFLMGTVQNGELVEVHILGDGEGYQAETEVIIVPAFATSTLWSFWIVDTLCCFIFLFNFVFELRLSESKKWYWKRHWVDFITSIPLPPLHMIIGATEGANMIRAGRIFRVVRILRTIRILRMFLFFWRGLDHLSTIMNVKLLKRSLLYGLLAMLGGVMLFMSLEKVKGGDGSFIESLWWSFTTLVTGGFADIHNPSTVGGKVLTVMLVIGGMVLVGVFTATLTSVLVRNDDSWQKQDTEEQLRQLNKLERTLESIDLRLKSIEEKDKDS